MTEPTNPSANPSANPAGNQTIQELVRIAVGDLENIDDPEALEQWRVANLGRRGLLTTVLRGIAGLDPEQRRAAGAAGNQAKTTLDAALEQRSQEINQAQMNRAFTQDQLDVTLPGRPPASGRLHPTTLILREICDAFTAMGFSIVEGPEVELDHYNFEMLNIPQGHPARDMWNSLWLDTEDGSNCQRMLLRTHTSPMQVRTMEAARPPVRVVVPGKCYRYEATDATHEWQLFQIEGLAVDEGITFADLKGTIYEFARQMFGERRRVRFRCDYFPFVEPGVEVAIDCFKCAGKGCRICSETGWIEIAGAGMVHPRVLEGVGYDPSVYTGFAFGFGVERVAMLKHGIDDIRLFYSNDVRFLRQF